MRADHSARGARPVAPWTPSLRPSGCLGPGGALQRPAPVEASGAMAPPSAVDAAAREVGVTVGGPARAGRADSAPETQRDHSGASTVADADEVELGGGSQASRCAGFVQAASAVLRSGRPGAAAVAERLSLQRALSAVQARLAGDPPAEGPRCALGSWARGELAPQDWARRAAATTPSVGTGPQPPQSGEVGVAGRPTPLVNSSLLVERSGRPDARHRRHEARLREGDAGSSSSGAASCRLGSGAAASRAGALGVAGQAAGECYLGSGALRPSAPAARGPPPPA